MNGTLLPQVNVQIQFQTDSCTGSCHNYFILQVWETSVLNKNSARIISNYRKVKTIAFTMDANNIMITSYATINFENPIATGFYMAIVDMNTCIVLTRVVVFYYVCPAMVKNLIKYPETFSSMNLSVLVHGSCVEGSSGEFQERNPQLTCQPGGSWEDVQSGYGCRCDHGFRHHEETEQCIGECLCYCFMVCNSVYIVVVMC